MVGHCIPNSRIVVDHWEEPTDSKVHFLTNFESTKIAGLTSAWRHKIFTSPINATFLKNVLKVDAAYVRPLAVGKQYSNHHKRSADTFVVALIPANHNPGSVMFLFEGSFGKVLYTGHFRCKPWMFVDSPLAHLVDRQELDILYMDNTFAARGCEIPSSETCLQKISMIVRDNPGRVVLAVPYQDELGLLTSIAEALKVKIAVSRKWHALLRKMLDEDQLRHFSDDPEDCDIQAVDISTLANNRNMYKRSVPILLTVDSRFKRRQFEAKGWRVHIVRFSLHNSHSELVNFVARLQPRYIIPIDAENRGQSVVPKELYDLCRDRARNVDLKQTSDVVVPCDVEESGTTGSEVLDVPGGYEISENCSVTLGQKSICDVKGNERHNFTEEVIPETETDSGADEREESMWPTCCRSKAVEETVATDGSSEPTSPPLSCVDAQTCVPTAVRSPPQHVSDDEGGDHGDDREVSPEGVLPDIILQQLIDDQWGGSPQRNSKTCSSQPEEPLSQGFSGEGVALPSTLLAPVSRLSKKEASTTVSSVLAPVSVRTVGRVAADGRHAGSPTAASGKAVFRAGQTVVTDRAPVNTRPGCSWWATVPEQGSVGRDSRSAHVTQGQSRGGPASAAASVNLCGSTRPAPRRGLGNRGEIVEDVQPQPRVAVGKLEPAARRSEHECWKTRYAETVSSPVRGDDNVDVDAYIKSISTRGDSVSNAVLLMQSSLDSQQASVLEVSRREVQDKCRGSGVTCLSAPLQQCTSCGGGVGSGPLPAGWSSVGLRAPVNRSVGSILETNVGALADTSASGRTIGPVLASPSRCSVSGRDTFRSDGSASVGLAGCNNRDTAESAPAVSVAEHGGNIVPTSARLTDTGNVRKMGDGTERLEERMTVGVQTSTSLASVGVQTSTFPTTVGLQTSTSTTTVGLQTPASFASSPTMSKDPPVANDTCSNACRSCCPKNTDSEAYSRRDGKQGVKKFEESTSVVVGPMEVPSAAKRLAVVGLRSERLAKKRLLVAIESSKRSWKGRLRQKEEVSRVLVKRSSSSKRKGKRGVSLKGSGIFNMSSGTKNVSPEASLQQESRSEEVGARAKKEVDEHVIKHLRSRTVPRTLSREASLQRESCSQEEEGRAKEELYEKAAEQLGLKVTAECISSRRKRGSYIANTLSVNNFWNTSNESDMIFQDIVCTTPIKRSLQHKTSQEN